MGKKFFVWASKGKPFQCIVCFVFGDGKKNINKKILFIGLIN